MQTLLFHVHRFLFACLLLSYLASNSAHAQLSRSPSLSHKNWIFGDGCSLTWVENNRGRFIPRTQAHNSDIDTPEGVATFSSPSTGDLILYSDGDQAWVAENSYISADPLGGDPSASQSAVIVPFPDSANEYYIFTQPISQGSIKYTTFDVSTVQQTSSTLLLPGTENSSEVIGVTKHRNGRDYWLVTTDQINQTVLVFSITPAGISAATVYDQNNPVTFGFGQAVFSSRSNKLVISGDNTNIWDFNPSTGEVDHQQALVGIDNESMYGSAFSHDDRMLYIYGYNPPRIYQVELSNGYDLEELFNNSQCDRGGALSLALDNKIYAACRHKNGVQPSLGVINNPSQASVAADFNPSGLQFTNCTVYFGLPTAITPYQRQVRDQDQDGFPDASPQEVDSDNDGILDADEIPAQYIYDRNSNQVPDYQDPDSVSCDDTHPADGFCDTLPVEVDTDGDGVPNHLDLDSDNDGLNDLIECYGREADLNGDGILDQAVDADQDGAFDLFDIDDNDATLFSYRSISCDNDQDGVLNPYDLDSNNDGISDIISAGGNDIDGDGQVDPLIPGVPIVNRDLDGNGLLSEVDLQDGGAPMPRCDDFDYDLICAEFDNCMVSYNPAQIDLNLDGVGDQCLLDIDNDGVLNFADNCTTQSNEDQLDLDGDGKGDLCDSDLDGDGILNAVDNCPAVANPLQEDLDNDAEGDLCDSDLDGDTILNELDNCRDEANLDQADLDLDDIGDQCDDDIDGDAVLNDADTCPLINGPNDDLDGDGQGDLCDSDLDGDGVLNAVDNCPTVVNPLQEDLDNDAEGDLCDSDLDGDTILNELDNCRDEANTDQADLDLDDIGDQCDDDIDGDAVLNDADTCPLINGPNDDLDSDGQGDLCDSDLDGDTVLNAVDNCPRVPNALQEDLDEDEIGDTCDPDLDGDGIVNADDNCPRLSNEEQLDDDQDGWGNLCDVTLMIADEDADLVLDEADNCPSVANPNQSDLDQDGVGDACDDDQDGDSLLNTEDNCPSRINAQQEDLDEDGIGDACDDDRDADNINNEQDNCPLTSNPEQEDLDQDGRGDACDTDRDGDGVTDANDLCPDLNAPNTDSNGNGIGDACEPNNTDNEQNTNAGIGVCDDQPGVLLIDSDGDGIGDPCDEDDDQDGIPDEEDNCPYVTNADQKDYDDDAKGDVCDPDVDGDEVDNLEDNCIYDPNPEQADINENGIGDACEGVDGEYGFGLQGAGCESQVNRRSELLFIVLSLGLLCRSKRRRGIA